MTIGILQRRDNDQYVVVMPGGQTVAVLRGDKVISHNPPLRIDVISDASLHSLNQLLGRRVTLYGDPHRINI